MCVTLFGLHLTEAGMVREDTTIQPREATTEDLMVVHPRSYIDSLRVSLP